MTSRPALYLDQNLRCSSPPDAQPCQHGLVPADVNFTTRNSDKWSDVCDCFGKTTNATVNKISRYVYRRERMSDFVSC